MSKGIPENKTYPYVMKVTHSDNYSYGYVETVPVLAPLKSADDVSNHIKSLVEDAQSEWMFNRHGSALLDDDINVFGASYPWRDFVDNIDGTPHHTFEVVSLKEWLKEAEPNV